MALLDDVDGGVVVAEDVDVDGVEDDVVDAKCECRRCRRGVRPEM